MIGALLIDAYDIFDIILITRPQHGGKVRYLIAIAVGAIAAKAALKQRSRKLWHLFHIERLHPELHQNIQWLREALEPYPAEEVRQGLEPYGRSATKMLMPKAS